MPSVFDTKSSDECIRAWEELETEGCVTTIINILF